MVEEHTIRKCQKAYDFLAFLVINNYCVLLVSGES